MIMKKMIGLVMILVTLCSVASSEVYPAVGVVYELIQETDTVVFEDYNGNLWLMEGIEDWKVGDIGALLMDDMETASIYDDEILEARYAGYISEE